MLWLYLRISIVVTHKCSFAYQAKIDLLLLYLKYIMIIPYRANIVLLMYSSHPQVMAWTWSVVVGLSFLHENIKRLREDDDNWMMVGFEMTFPTLLEMAKDIGLDIPYDEPVLQDIYAKRELKLAKYDNYTCLF